MIQNLFFNFKEHLLASIILILIFIIFISIILYKFKTILSFIKFTLELLNILSNIVVEPIKFLSEIIKFQIIKINLSVKLALILKIKNDCLLPNIFLNFILLFLSLSIIFIAHKIGNDDYKSTLYMIDGAIISIWITHITSIVVSINRLIENLENSYTAVADIRQLLATHYELLIPFFPYKDNLFKRGDDILYITPVRTGVDDNYLNEELAKTFLTYLGELDLKTLYTSFDTAATKNLIMYISNHQINRQMTQNTVISSKEYMSNVLNSLFQQVLSCINKIIAFNLQYPIWDTDKELSPQMSMFCYIYILKLTNCIIFAQREFALYDRYIKHISHPPTFSIIKNLDDAVKSNTSIKNKHKVKVK